MNETWKDIPGYLGIYQVSDLGNVRNLEYYITEKSGKVRKRRARLLSKKLPKGARYYQIILFNNGKCKLWRIHQLVALAFIPNPNNLPEINHKDHNRFNNTIVNLEWCDRKHNCVESFQFHKIYGEKVYNAKLKNVDIPIIRDRLATGDRIVDIAKTYNVAEGTIQKIKLNKSWKRII